MDSIGGIAGPPVNVQFKFIFVDKDFVVSRCAVEQFVSYYLVHCRLRM